MNQLDTRDRRGAHRMQRGPLQAVVPGLLAVAAVAALVVAVLVMRGTAPNTTVAAGATSSPRASTAASATATPAGTSSSTPSGAASPTSDGTTPTADASPTPSGTVSGSGDVKSSASVVVLNQTRIGGLAGRVAQTLRDAGWTVTSTGNFSGNVPATTVYYPDGMQAAAEALAADVPGPDRVRPRFGNLSKDKLTVIVTSAAG